MPRVREVLAMGPGVRGPCVACGKVLKLYRGLCHVHYRDRAGRAELEASGVIQAPQRPGRRRGSGTGLMVSRGPAPAATGAGVGGPGKIEVMAARAALGVDLFHPGDNQEADPLAGLSGDGGECLPGSVVGRKRRGRVARHAAKTRGRGAGPDGPA